MSQISFWDLLYCEVCLLKFDNIRRERRYQRAIGLRIGAGWIPPSHWWGSVGSPPGKNAILDPISCILVHFQCHFFFF